MGSKDLKDTLSGIPFLSAKIPYLDKKGNPNFICKQVTDYMKDKGGRGDKSRFGDLIPCHLCTKSIRRALMRVHVAGHLVQQGLDAVDPYTCGYCGWVGQCSVSFKDNSRRGALVPMSNCSSQYDFRYKAASTFSANNKSTNVPMLCTSCGLCIWKYNAAAHFRTAHVTDTVPDQYTVTTEEVDALKFVFKA